MARASDGNEQLLCSFCGKSQRQVKKLIAGPGVYICDECIDLCNEIIDEELTAPAALDLHPAGLEYMAPDSGLDGFEQLLTEKLRVEGGCALLKEAVAVLL